MKTNDLLAGVDKEIFPQPVIFAAASLGIGTNNIPTDGHSCGFDMDTLTPFGNIHIVSGFYHTHLLGANTLNDQSGIIRFNQAAGDFQLSTNGGISFFNAGDYPGPHLQICYNNGQSLILNSSNGDLTLNVESSQLVLGGFDPNPSFNISGLIPPPSQSHALGDIGFLLHSQVDQNLADVTTLAQLSARSLGIGSLYLNTGSGLINIAVGSGFIQVRNTDGSQNIPAVGNTNLAMPGEDFSDLNFPHLAEASANSNRIAIMSSGFYKCTYNISFQKNTATAAIVMKTEATLNTIAISNSVAYSLLRDSDHNMGTNKAIFLFQAKPGDLLRIRCSRSGDPVGTVGTADGEGWIMLEKIGPQRK